jgi:hypothetical protein
MEKGRFAGCRWPGSTSVVVFGQGQIKVRMDQVRGNGRIAG